MARFRALALKWIAVLVCYGVSAPGVAASPCDGPLLAQVQPHARRAVTEETLVGLRDIGPIYRADAARAILAVSPDARWAAFELHRGDPSDNRYCAAMVVVPLKAGGEPIVVDASDELVPDRSPAFGWAAFETGVSAPVTPHWSPDGQWIAFLKRRGGSTQVWIADTKGHSRQLTHSGADVEDLRIMAEGRTVVFASRPDLADQEALIDREGLRGWRADARFLPLRGPRPQSPAVPRRYLAIDIADGAIRDASAQEIAAFARPEGIPPDATVLAAARNRLAWIEPQKDAPVPAPHDLVVQSATGARSICSASLCGADALSRVWWTADGTTVRFTRREGWAGSLTAVYEWKPDMERPRRLLVTPDALIDCQPLESDLLCLRETSTQPRRLVTLGLGTNSSRMLFDPNPEFASLSLGRVERRHWRNSSGIPFYGDLVYPVGYSATQRYPLVVVQYRSKGFLRGGTGDEVPIQALANRGYFVLVADIRDAGAIVGPRKSAAALQHAYERELTGTRNVLSAIERQVTDLIETGLVDRDCIGITGLSAGSLTVQFAAKHSAIFAAGSLSGCCLDPAQDAFMGPMISERYHEAGWPKMAEGDAASWKQISLWSEPQNVRFPLLFQAADNEYLAAVASHTALRQARVPTDLYIFPGEFHLKAQPAHQLSAYRRNMAWFDFWLKGCLPAEEAERQEAMRWQEMRDQWKTAAISADQLTSCATGESRAHPRAPQG